MMVHFGLSLATRPGTMKGFPESLEGVKASERTVVGGYIPTTALAAAYFFAVTKEMAAVPGPVWVPSTAPSLYIGTSPL